VVQPDLVADPGRLSTARLDVTTGPLTARLGGRGDNRAAQDLAAVLDAEHDFIARGGLLAGYAADLVAHSAVQAQQAVEAAGRDRALADALEQRASAVSGVNLDEEMAHMVQLQQAYAASARMVAVTDELFDELLATVR
jgi:flagellar hook-associated protein 1 FlgK